MLATLCPVVKTCPTSPVAFGLFNLKRNTDSLSSIQHVALCTKNVIRLRFVLQQKLGQTIWLAMCRNILGVGLYK